MNAFVMSVRTERMVLGLVVALVLMTRLPFLATTLEDLDSVNFELGVHDFDPYEHRPHPPGNAVFIAIAKLTHPISDRHATALALPSAVLSALAAIPLYLLARNLAGQLPALLALALVAFNPLFWINSVRPLSDVTGFTAIITAQSLLVSAILSPVDRRGRSTFWYAGTIVAALAVGVRLQAIVLVGPVLAAGWLLMRPVRLLTPVLFALTVAIWLVPTLNESGGAERFWTKQVEIVTEVAPAESLVVSFSLPRLWQGLADTFVSSWSAWWLAAAVLLLSVLGVRPMWRGHRKHVYLLVVLFLPYAVYHVLLQETNMLRYTLPLIPPVAILASVAVAAAAGVRPIRVAGVAAAFLLVSGLLTGGALAAYRAPSPPAAAVARLDDVVRTTGHVVVGAHRVFERYLTPLPAVVERVPVAPLREWRGMNDYWRAGRQEPIWFVNDMNRTTLALVDGSSRTRVGSWAWPDSLARLMKGARPIRVSLERLEPPRWFAETGFLMSHEAGLAEDVKREPYLLYADGALAGSLIVSGLAEGPTLVTPVIDDVAGTPWMVSGAFSLPLAVASGSEDPYVPVLLDAAAPLTLLDVSVATGEENLARTVNGFYGEEPDETGARFRWMSVDSQLFVVRNGKRATLTLVGRVPTQYYETPPKQIAVTVDDRAPIVKTIDQDRFEIAIELENAPVGSITNIALTASASFVPATLLGNDDRRPLSLMIYDVRVTVP